MSRMIQLPKDYITPQERTHFETDWPLWAQLIGICVFLGQVAYWTGGWR